MQEKAKIILLENEEMINNKQKKFYSLYINSDGSPETIHELAKSENISLSLFIEYICSYINTHIEKTHYAIILERLALLDINDEEIIIKYLKEINLPISVLENSIINYMINYRPDAFIYRDDRLLINLKRKINLYKNYLITENLSDNKIIPNSNYEIAKDTITRFITSSFSKERFCLHERISSLTFRDRLAIIKSESLKEKKNAKENNQEEPTTLYDIYLNCLNIKNEKIQNTIEDNIYTIFNLVKELGDDFCSIDLFMNTYYGGNEILKYADNILNIEDARLFRRYVSVYKKVNVLNTKAIENLLKEKTIININNQIIEVDNNVKLEIINFLDENNIPISLDSFRNACNRYYQEKLYPSKHR